MSSDDTDRSLVYELASETMDWMAAAPMGKREDVSDKVWAYSLATFVDGVPVTPQGYDESHQFRPVDTETEQAGVSR